MSAKVLFYRCFYTPKCTKGNMRVVVCQKYAKVLGPCRSTASSVAPLMDHHVCGWLVCGVCGISQVWNMSIIKLNVQVEYKTTKQATLRFSSPTGGQTGILSNTSVWDGCFCFLFGEELYLVMLSWLNLCDREKLVLREIVLRENACEMLKQNSNSNNPTYSMQDNKRWWFCDVWLLLGLKILPVSRVIVLEKRASSEPSGCLCAHWTGVTGHLHAALDRCWVITFSSIWTILRCCFLTWQASDLQFTLLWLNSGYLQLSIQR